ncbi:hypothetical protein D9M71_436630 [compost metagenome]
MTATTSAVRPLTATVSARLAPITLLMRSMVIMTISANASTLGNQPSALATSSWIGGRRQDGRCSISMARPRPVMKALNTTRASTWLARLAISEPSSALLSSPQRSSDTEPAMVPRVARLTPSANALRRRRPSGNQLTMALASRRSSTPRTRVQTRIAATRLVMNSQRCSALKALSIASTASPRRSRRRATSSWVGRMMLCQKAGLSGEAARLVICELNWLRRRLTICVDRSRADWVSLVA